MSLTALLAALTALLAVAAALQHRALRQARRALARTEAAAAERRRIQEAAECMRCMHEGIVLVSREGTIAECNPAAEQILGATALGLKGRPVRDFYASPLDCDALMTATVENGRTPPRTALMKRTDGTKKLVHISTSQVDEHDQSRIVQVFRDCADLRTMEERLLQSERLATIGRFASQIAHEIRNPLGSISLNLEMLADETRGAGGQRGQLITSVLGELDRLNGIIAEYLQFSRFPKPRLEKGRIEAVLRDLQQNAVAPPGVRLSVRVAPGTPAAWFDATLIRQALDNLVRNALDATSPSGEVQVEADAINRFLMIRVRDTGPGIPPELQEKLFEPFFTTKANGTGLGLAITQQIIFEHNGHIQVESQPGRGSTFTVYLPL